MDELLEDLHRVKKQNQGKLDKFFYDAMGNYSVEEVENELGSWQEALKAVNATREEDEGKNPRKQVIDKAALLTDLRKAARESSLPFTPKKYDKIGKYSRKSISRIIGSWGQGREEADIKEIEKDKAEEMTRWLSSCLGLQEDLTGQVNGYLEGVDERIDDKHVLGAFYCAIRFNDEPYTMKDIGRILDERDKQDVYEGYREVSARLGEYIEPVPVEAFAKRYWRELGLGDESRVIEEAKKIRPESSSPHTYAAGLVYLIGKRNSNNLTQREVAEIANCTEVTIRENKKKVKKKLY